MSAYANHTTTSMENPFPGLRAFLDAESHLFFGREKHLADLRSKLEAQRFVAVVGTSGTGKSSLIRAGLLPALAREVNGDGSAKWRLLTITPGNNPLGRLAQTLAATYSNGPAVDESILRQAQQLLQESSLGLVQTLRPLLPPNERLLVLVDQFEEIFRFNDEAGHAGMEAYSQFVQLIVDSVKQRDVPIYALLTLRSDFIGDCVEFEGLPEAINDGHYLVPKMNQSEVRRAITGPIDYAGGKISPRLIQHIIQNLGHSPDQLPVLQHAMMRTWDYWTAQHVAGEPIDLKHFEAIGGLDDALSSHADEAFAELDAQQQLLAEKVFKCLTTKQSDNRGVRRPLPLKDLAAITDHTEQEVLSVLMPFRKPGRSFILPGLEAEAHAASIFDISHESLMRGWKRLSHWVDEEMESAEFYERICTAALLHKRGASALWRNPELQLALDWKARQQPSQAWAALYNPHLDAALSFLDESEKAYREERSRKRRRLVIIRSAVATFIVVVSILAAWAMNQTRIAQAKTVETEHKTIEALEQKGIAESAREEALRASERAEQARLRAEEQATIAEEQAAIAEEQERIAQQERSKAERSALRALQGEEQALAQKELADRKSREAEQQRQKADSARLETTRLRLIALGQKLAFEANQVTQNAELSGLLAIEAYQLALDNGGNTNEGTLYAAATKAMKDLSPELSSVVHQHPEEVLGIHIANQGLSLADRSGKLQRYTLPDFKLEAEHSTGLKADLINTAFFDESGTMAAFGLNDFSLHLVHTDQAKAHEVFQGHQGLVRSALFLKGEPFLITAGRDQKVLSWSKDGAFGSTGLSSRIRAMCLDAEGAYCYVGCENGRVYRLDANGKNTTVLADRQPHRVESITASAQGKFLAVGFSDGVVQVLQSNGALLKELVVTGSVSHLGFDEQRDVLAVATAGKMLYLYSLSNLTALPISIRTEREIRAMAADRKHGDLYLYTNDGKLQRFPVQTASLIADLRNKIQRNLSIEEWHTFMGIDVPYPYLESLKP